jgi:hypothetical protein
LTIQERWEMYKKGIVKGSEPPSPELLRLVEYTFFSGAFALVCSQDDIVNEFTDDMQAQEDLIDLADEVEEIMGELVSEVRKDIAELN